VSDKQTIAKRFTRTALFTQRSARRASRRRGAVLVETAIVIMLLITLCFGIMEYGHYVYTRHTLESACQRAVRFGIIADSVFEDVETEVSTQMAVAGYDATEFDVEILGHGDPAETDLTISIEVTWGQIGMRPLGLISADSVIRASATMRKEMPPPAP
jgi:Flp pilus assembly protein TadG